MTHRIPGFLLLVLLSLSLLGPSAQEAGDTWRIIFLDAEIKDQMMADE